MKPAAAILCAALALAPLAAPAQSLLDRLATAPEISESAWRDMTAGKTVVYEIDDAIYGYETYRKNSNRISIRLENGTCINGQWFMQQTAFCFDWEGGPLNCFNHKELDGDIYVVGLENGMETEDIQKVARIDDRPVFCGPALLSTLMPEAKP